VLDKIVLYLSKQLFMSIEKEIKSKFRNEHHKASVNLLYTCNWLQEQLKKHFDRGGLTNQQYNILRILRGSDAPLSTLKIRERMLDKMSDTSRIVDRLVVKGLVDKKINTVDKRLVDITIAQKGLELINWLDNFADDVDGTMQNLSDEEVTLLNNLLDKIRNVG
jgi:DNA-binding MarR family transcriptional regulator